MAEIMTTLTIPELLERIEYPDRDGLPMSENTLQWYWMVLGAEQQQRRAEQQQQAANQEKARADRLAEKLRALGIDPDTDAT